MTLSLVRGSSKDDLSQATPPQQPTCLASSGRASDTCGRRHLDSPPWKLTSLKTFQEESIPRPSSRGRTCPVNHLSYHDIPMYPSMLISPTFQNHVDRQEWLNLLPSDMYFIPLDFNPFKAHVIAQSSGKRLDPPLF